MFIFYRSKICTEESALCQSLFLFVFCFAEIDKFTHEVEEVLHEVEEVLHDVKEHMILSVRDYSLQIAFVLMGITSAILVVGTVYVWCFHHPKRLNRKDGGQLKQKQLERSDKDHSEHTDNVASERSQKENAQEESFEKSVDKAGKPEDDVAGNAEQNGQVRKRTTSSSVNNNNSPVKSKIPVRQKSKTS